MLVTKFVIQKTGRIIKTACLINQLTAYFLGIDLSTAIASLTNFVAAGA